jgi:amino acid permease
MRDLKFIIIFLIIILFSGLGVSYYTEGLDCAEDEVNNNGTCQQKNEYKQKLNKFLVIIILVCIIMWIVVIKPET